MRIALVHYRVGENDGVSLEMEKWRRVLTDMGHRVVYLAGSLGNVDGYEVPSIRYDHPENAALQTFAFEDGTLPEREFVRRFSAYKETIKDEVSQALRSLGVGLLIVNNIWSLGHNLAAGVAFTELVEELGLRAIGHHHDFFWERERYAKPRYHFVKEVLETYFPPNSRLIEHVVINRLAEKALKERRGINARVVPNVFDFEQPPWVEDAFNADFREKLGLSEEDLVFLQATRIVPRKAIELSIDFVSTFQGECMGRLTGKVLYNGRRVTENSRIVLLLAGQPEDPGYLSRLEGYAKDKGVDLLKAFHLVRSARSETPTKFYTLWDTYVVSDVVMYPSIKEGWGNQFIEAIFAKRPIVVFEYPVFVSDILPLGFWYISLGREYDVSKGLVRVPLEVMQRATHTLCDALDDTEETRRKLYENFQLGREHLSLRYLRELLRTLV